MGKEINSYLIEAKIYDIDGNQQTVPGVTTKEKCLYILKEYNRKKKRRYDPYHKSCNGRGYLSLDDGKVFYDNDENKLVYSSWLQTCDCVNKIVDKDKKLKDILIGKI